MEDKSIYDNKDDYEVKHCNNSSNPLLSLSTSYGK